MGALTMHQMMHVPVAVTLEHSWPLHHPLWVGVQVEGGRVCHWSQGNAHTGKLHSLRVTIKRVLHDLCMSLEP